MTMPPSEDAKWPRLLSLAVHEFRTPMTVVAGYIRMLLKDRGGPLSDQQRRLLQEAEKSCARLAALLTEMSDLAKIEAGAAPLNRSTVDLRALLTDAIAALPPVDDRAVEIQLTTSTETPLVHGDAVRLKTAFSSLLYALRRELVSSDILFVREHEGEFRGKPASWVAFGDAQHIDQLADKQRIVVDVRIADVEGKPIESTSETYRRFEQSLESMAAGSLTTFDEWRGGCGLSLAVARRIVDGHGGAMWSPGQGTKAGAVVALPRSQAPATLA